MSEFLVGAFSAVLLYVMTYSYMPQEARDWYTDHLVGPVLDTAFLVASLALAGSTAGSLYMATGMSVGFSLIMRLLAYINVHWR